MLWSLGGSILLCVPTIFLVLEMDRAISEIEFGAFGIGLQTLILCFVTATGFHVGVENVVRRGSTVSWPTESGVSWRRTSLRAVTLAYSLSLISLGIGLISINDPVAGFVFCTLGMLLLVVILFRIIRRPRQKSGPPFFELEESFRNTLTFALTVAVSMAFIILASVWSTRGFSWGTVILLSLAALTIFPSTVTGTKFLLREEASRPIEYRILHLTTPISGIASLIVIFLCESLFMFLERWDRYYPLALIVFSILLLPTLWVRCKKAEQKLSIPVGASQSLP